MKNASRTPRPSPLRRHLALLPLCAALCFAPAALAQQQLQLGKAFSAAPSSPMPSGAEILKRALDNLYGFDASIQLVTQMRNRRGGSAMTSEFVLERKRTEDALRTLVVSLRPAEVRGTRILQINYDDGRENTFAYLPSVGGSPMQTAFRLAEPFLGTWHEVTDAERGSMSLGSISEYEVLALQHTTAQDEPAYLLTVRPLVTRGYEWAKLLIATSDYAVLEQRQYFGDRETPALVYRAPRASMVRFKGNLVPGRVLFVDMTEDAEIEVQLRHSELPEGSEALFLPRTFHRVPLGVLDDR